MRGFRILGIVLGGLVALFAIVLIAVWLFVNPNDYKDRIAKAVEDNTGRTLALPGDIKLSVFPWIALELGPASLGNPPGFAAGPFASFQHAALRVKLLPLLHKTLQIGRIEVDGLDLRLQKNAEGKGNWQDLGGKKGPAEVASARSGPVALPDLAGVLVTNGRLSYGDIILEHVNLDVGHLASGLPVPIKLTLQFTGSRGAQPIGLAGDINVVFDPANKRLRISPAEFNGTLIPKPGAEKVQWKLSTPDLSVDLGAQTLSMPQLAMQFADVHLSGSVRGNRIVDAPRIDGSFKLDPVAPRALLSHLGITPPVTRDAKALARLSASGEFNYGGRAAGATHLDVRLDDSKLTGDATITNLDTWAMQFDLALDRIDIDRYLSPEQAPTRSDVKPPAAPPSALKSLRVNGRVTIGGTTIAGVNLSDVRVGIASRDGLVRISPAAAKLYGGSYSGDITLDLRGSQPTIKLDQRMSDIDVAQLLQDFAKTRRFSGRGTVTTNLTAHGGGHDALLGSLNGRVTANLSNGAVEGVDLWWEVNRAMALVQKQALPAGNGSGRTAFETFKASADLTNGVAVTKDLNIASQNLHVTGEGTANLVSQAIDYRVLATLLKGAAGEKAANARTLADIPVAITGSMSNPKVRPDLQGIAKARLQQELDKRKADLKQKLQDKLKGLFH